MRTEAVAASRLHGCGDGIGRGTRRGHIRDPLPCRGLPEAASAVHRHRRSGPGRAGRRTGACASSPPTSSSPGRASRTRRTSSSSSRARSRSGTSTTARPSCATCAAPATGSAPSSFTARPACLYTARATTDVVTYGFPVLRCRGAARAAIPMRPRSSPRMGSVESTFTAADAAADPLNTYLQQLAGPLRSCSARTTVREAARRLLDSGADALAVTGDDASLAGRGHAAGAAGVDRARRRRCRPSAVGDRSCRVPDWPAPTRRSPTAPGPWRRAARSAMTADGTAQRAGCSRSSRPRDLLPALGDQPAAILERHRAAPPICRACAR